MISREAVLESYRRLTVAQVIASELAEAAEKGSRQVRQAKPGNGSTTGAGAEPLPSWSTAKTHDRGHP